MMRQDDVVVRPLYGQEKGPVANAIRNYKPPSESSYGLSDGLGKIASAVEHGPNYWSTNLGHALSTASVELNNAVMHAIRYSRGDITNKTRRWAERHHRVVVEKPKPKKKPEPSYAPPPPSYKPWYL